MNLNFAQTSRLKTAVKFSPSNSHRYDSHHGRWLHEDITQSIHAQFSAPNFLCSSRAYDLDCQTQDWDFSRNDQALTLYNAVFFGIMGRVIRFVALDYLTFKEQLNLTTTTATNVRVAARSSPRTLA